MWCLPFVLWRRNPVLFVCLKKEQSRWIIHAALQRQHSRLNDEGIYEILSLSLFFTHTFSLSHSSLSLSPFFSLSLREGLRRWSVRRGEDFTRRWGDGKTCPSNVSHRSQRGPDPKATSNLTLSFDLLSPLLTGNSATPCSLFKPLWVCVCVIFWPSQTPTEQKCGHLSRHRRSEVLLRCQNVVHWLDITVSCGGSVSTSHLQLWLLSVLTRLDRAQVSRGCGSIQGLLTSGLIFPPLF